LRLAGIKIPVALQMRMTSKVKIQQDPGPKNANKRRDCKYSGDEWWACGGLSDAPSL